VAKLNTKFRITFIATVVVSGIIVANYNLLSIHRVSIIRTTNLSIKFDSVNVFYGYKKNKVEDLITVNNKNILAVRKKMINIVFGNSQLPKLLPDSVFETKDSLYSDIPNLKSLEKFMIFQKYNIQSIGYIFNPKINNHRLFIYHQGHSGDFILGKSVIKFFVNQGFTVYAFCMPLIGKNNQPVVTIDNIGTFKLSYEMESHELMKFLDYPISFFATPVVAMINFAQTKNIKDITMCGISGGGWTTTIASAMDTRINYSFPVAGSYPMYIKLNSTQKSYGDFEQVYPQLYRNINYLDMYILASTGKNRFQVQMLNRSDPCCFDGEYYKHYEFLVKRKVKKLGDGDFEVISDTSNSGHSISELHIQKIYEKLSSN